jgi:Zn finger protein HypA/HybF involved in hydrogenase expression
MSTLEIRVRRLEDASFAVAGGGGGEGCPRCVGVLVIVSDAVSGEFDSASWNGEPLSEHETHEHETEHKCPRCGRKLDHGERLEIGVGGRET